MKNKLKLLCLITITLHISSCSKIYYTQTPQNYDTSEAVIIPIAHPNTIVSATGAFYSRLMPIFGFGKYDQVRAGHASMVIVEKGSDEFQFYDFGRYDPQKDTARARGANTDPSLKINTKAEWKNGKLTNIEEMLLELYCDSLELMVIGDLYASVCDDINYTNAMKYIDDMQNAGVHRYGPFDKKGTNCARFVVDAIHFATTNEEIKQRAKKISKVSPTVLASVRNLNTDGIYYIVNNDSVFCKQGEVPRKLDRKYMVDFGKGFQKKNYEGKMIPPKDIEAHKNWLWLSGVSSGRWFDIEKSTNGKMKVISYNKNAKEEYRGIYKAEKEVDFSKGYKLDYPSTYKFITLIIDEEKVRLYRISDDF